MTKIFYAMLAATMLSFLAITAVPAPMYVVATMVIALELAMTLLAVVFGLFFLARKIGLISEVSWRLTFATIMTLGPLVVGNFIAYAMYYDNSQAWPFGLLVLAGTSVLSLMAVERIVRRLSAKFTTA